MLEQLHTFAGNPLDRGDVVRRDEERISQLYHAPDTQILLFSNLKVATQSDQLNWRKRNEIEGLPHHDAVFLGLRAGTALFAANTHATNLEFSDCRAVAATLTSEDTGILAQARAQLDWHQRNPFCAQCGAATHAERGGQIRRCDACDKHIFPRTDPVAIMLIVDQPGGDRCLLGKSQGRMAQSNFYSALAGFLDQGESLEEGVRREVMEEAGVQVGQVRYHSSQPWPFPSQLMIGCHGIATSHDIQVDPVEMADVSWFTRAEAQNALEQKNAQLRVPGSMAIAHHLIRSWVYGEIDL